MDYISYKICLRYLVNFVLSIVGIFLLFVYMYFFFSLDIYFDLWVKNKNKISF